MAAVLHWVRHDVGRRWGSLLVLALLVAVSVGVVLAAATAAHRGATALDRLDERSRPATVQVPNLDSRVDLSVLAGLPYVAGVSRISGGGIGLLDDGMGGSTEQDVPVDGVLLDRIERPVVLDGRMYDAAAPDEAVVTPAWADTLHKGVGDTASIRLPTPEEQATGGGESLHGPVVTMRIVGIVKAPAYLDWPGQPGWFIPSPGLFAAHRANWDTSLTRPHCPCQWASVGAYVRLAHGVDDMGRLRADLIRLFPGHTFNLQNLEVDREVHEHDITVQCWWIGAFAGAALIAGTALIGQAIARHVLADRDQSRTARALGMTSRQYVAAASLGPVLAAGGGSVVGAAAAAVTSKWTPIGLAAVPEPAPGFRLDLGLLLAGIAATVVVALGVAALTAYRSIRTAPRTTASSTSLVASGALRLGLPVPVQVGARFALEPGGPARSVPVVQTLTAVVVAVAGTSAALIVNSGVGDALAHPARFGQTFESVSFTGFGSTEFLDPDQIAAAVRPIDYVTGYALPRESAASADHGTVGVPLLSYTRTDKPLSVVVIGGRLPEAANEVALAPATLRALGDTVGDSVVLAGDRGSTPMRIVGQVLMPSTRFNRYDAGGWVTDAAYDRLFSGFDAHWVMVATAPSAGAGGRVQQRLTDDAAATLGRDWAQNAGFDEMGTEALTTEPLRQVRWFPVALCALLGLLATAALTHAGAVAIRRRSGELAVLRALGMTRAGTRLAVLAQAGIVGAVGLVVGLPLGAAVGRTLWRVIATRLPLQVVPPPLAGLWGVVPAVLVIALLLALVPAVRVARLPLAELLRAE